MIFFTHDASRYPVLICCKAPHHNCMCSRIIEICYFCYTILCSLSGDLPSKIFFLCNCFCRVLKMPLLLSDSHLHLFLQSQLSIAKMEACVQGQTSYTVAEAIQRYVYDTHFPLEDESKSLCDYDCKRCACVFLCV